MIQIEASLVKSEKPLDLSNELLMNYHSDLTGNIFPYLNHFIEINNFTCNIGFFLGVYIRYCAILHREGRVNEESFNGLCLLFYKSIHLK